MADGIQPNPLLALLPEPLEVSGQRPTEEPQARMWTSVTALVALIRAMLGLFEFHIETVNASGSRIPHRLGRRPFGRIILWQSANTVVYDDYEKWTTEHVRLYTAARSCRVAFALIGLLLVLSGQAGAAECATYGYAEGEPVRLWLCALAVDTTTGAREGDYRYNKDTNAVQSYDGAAWNAVGGGGSTPTGTGYVHVTAGVQDALADLVTLTSATDVASAQGSTTTVLHGNLIGLPSWGSVALGVGGDVSGVLGAANGGTGTDTTVAAANRTFVTTGSSYATTVLPGCTDTGGNHLNYDNATQTFSCGTTGPSGSGLTHPQVMTRVAVTVGF